MGGAVVWVRSVMRGRCFDVGRRGDRRLAGSNSFERKGPTSAKSAYFGAVGQASHLHYKNRSRRSATPPTVASSQICELKRRGRRFHECAAGTAAPQLRRFYETSVCLIEPLGREDFELEGEAAGVVEVREQRLIAYPGYGGIRPRVAFFVFDVAELLPRLAFVF